MTVSFERWKELFKDKELNSYSTQKEITKHLSQKIPDFNRRVYIIERLNRAAKGRLDFAADHDIIYLSTPQLDELEIDEAEAELLIALGLGFDDTGLYIFV